jgi:pimeloyl-ACP methyl ester carboxylesterase
VEKWIGDLLVDISPPEKPKFKAPLVLLHGLWSDSSCWRQWASHFANLGWECWAANWRGRFESRALEVLGGLTFEGCVADLRRILRAAPAPPVLLAHGFGGLVAYIAAHREALSALVLVSTPPPREIPMNPTRALTRLRLKYSPLLWLGRPFRPEDKDLCRTWLASVPIELREEVCRRFVPEAGRLARAFFQRSIGLEPRHPGCPTLVVAGDSDQVVPLAAQQALAKRLDADIQVHPERGHWIIEEQGGETIVRDTHRWLVRKLGEEILLAELPPREPNTRP